MSLLQVREMSCQELPLQGHKSFQERGSAFKRIETTCLFMDNGNQISHRTSSFIFYPIGFGISLDIPLGGRPEAIALCFQVLVVPDEAKRLSLDALYISILQKVRFLWLKMLQHVSTIDPAHQFRNWFVMFFDLSALTVTRQNGQGSTICDLQSGHGMDIKMTLVTYIRRHTFPTHEFFLRVQFLLNLRIDRMISYETKGFPLSPACSSDFANCLKVHHVSGCQF